MDTIHNNSTELSDKTNSGEITTISSDITLDLTAFFRMINDDIHALISVASENQWSEDRLLREIDKLFGDEQDEQYRQDI